MLTLPDGSDFYDMHSGASKNGPWCLSMQNVNMFVYALRQLKPQEKNYRDYDLKLAASVFDLKIWMHYLYEVKCRNYTDYKNFKYILRELSMH